MSRMRGCHHPSASEGGEWNLKAPRRSATPPAARPHSPASLANAAPSGSFAGSIAARASRSLRRSSLAPGSPIASAAMVPIAKSITLIGAPRRAESSSIVRNVARASAGGTTGVVLRDELRVFFGGGLRTSQGGGATIRRFGASWMDFGLGCRPRNRTWTPLAASSHARL
jgi:hypothetical protein